MNIKRGDIILVNLDPVIGSEEGKTRPALVIQNDVGNKFSSTIIIAPITSNILSTRFITSVLVKKEFSKLKNDSVVLLNQIRSIDKMRIKNHICSLNNEIMEKVDKAILISLGINR